MRQATDQEGDGLTIAEAARVLGVSENAVRQRIKRESVTARKVENVWRIWLPDHQRSRSSDHETGYQATTSADHQADQEPTRRITVTPAALSQLDAIRDQWLQ